jgi:hypothetical protein
MSSKSKTLRCLDKLSKFETKVRRSRRRKTDHKLEMNQLKRIIGLSGGDKCNLMNMIKELDVILKNPEIVNLKNLTAMWKSANTIIKNVKALIATSTESNPRLISFARMLEQKISILKNKITRLLIKHRYLIKKERGGKRFRRTGPASYHAIQKLEAFNEMKQKALEMIILEDEEKEEEEDAPYGCRNHRDLRKERFNAENPPVFEDNDYCFSQNDLDGSKNTLIGKIKGIGGYLPTDLFLTNPYTNQKFKKLPVNNRNTYSRHRMFELMYGVGKEARTPAENNELLGLLGINEDDYDRLEGAEFNIDLMRYLQQNQAIQQEYIRVADALRIVGAYDFDDGNFGSGFISAEPLGQILAKMRTDGNVQFTLPGETSDRRATPELLWAGYRLNIRGPDSDEDMSFRMRSGQKNLDQKMLKELKLLQQEVSTINKHRISHLKSQHKRLQKRIVKGLPVNYDKYKKNVNTRMKQRLKRVDKSLNVYEKATKKRSRKVSRKSSRKRRSVKRKVSRKRRSVKRKVSRKRRSVKRKVSRKRRSVKRKVSRKRKSAKRKSRKRKSVKRKSRKSSRKRRGAKKKR